MKRVRLILALMLCLALTCLSATGLAAPKAATAKPTVKITVPKGTMRGGVGGELTVSPSAAGFLTLRLLDESGAELAVICDHQEVHTKANAIAFDACDADGASLPAGSYMLSATVTSQYGVESKEATAKLKLGDPRPELQGVDISASKAFNPIVSFNASFSDKQAEVTLSLYRVNPKAMYYDDFPAVTLKAPGVSSTTIDLTKGNDLPTPAGYYQVKGALGETGTGIYSKPIEVDFIVDVNGSAYLLEDAPEEALAALDQLIADYDAGELTASGAASTETDSASTKTASADSKTQAADGDDGEDEGEDAGETKKPAKSTAASTAKTATATASDDVAYEGGSAKTGGEGLEVGVGVSDTADQKDAGYWGLTASASDKEIWAALTRTMVSVDVGENESAYIYDSTEEGRKRLGTVSGLSQGLNVVMELENGWSLVEAFRNDDGAFVRGYIRTNKLRTVEPNQTYGIVIDKTAQTLTVWKDGAPIGSCSVSTGLPTPKYLFRETPAGEYITVTRRGTTEYYGKGYCKYTIRISGSYHLSEIPTTKKNGSDFSLLADSLGEKATRGNICIAHDASTDGGINAEWIWEMTTDNKKVKVLIFDDKDRTEVPVGE